MTLWYAMPTPPPSRHAAGLRGWAGLLFTARHHLQGGRVGGAGMSHMGWTPPPKGALGVGLWTAPPPPPPSALSTSSRPLDPLA